MRKPVKPKPRKLWMPDPPGTGGVAIPPDMQARVRARIEAFAAEHYAGNYTRLDIRFKGKFCYIDAYAEPTFYYKSPTNPETEEEYRERIASTPIHLCRLRYRGNDDWEWAFYKYSDEKYALSIFENGTFIGTPEEAFDISARVYLLNH